MSKTNAMRISGVEITLIYFSFTLANGLCLIAWSIKYILLMLGLRCPVSTIDKCETVLHALCVCVCVCVCVSIYTVRFVWPE